MSDRSNMNSVLVSGATGFVGSALYSALKDNGFEVKGTSRTKHPDTSIVEWNISDEDSLTLNFDLDGIDCVVHCAALAHIPDLNDESKNLARLLNVKAAKCIAAQARESKVKRFIFLSSVKAMGEATDTDKPFTYVTESVPVDLYGHLKRDAELEIQRELLDSETDLIIIRSPLVYGAGVKGNFQSLISLAGKDIPLPFKSVNNKRSLVALDNLVDLIETCIKYHQPINDTFLVSDGYDVSTKELFELIAKSSGKKPKLFPFPVSVMKMFLRFMGQKSAGDKLFGNLQVDISHTERMLNWRPKVLFKQAIRDCVQSTVNPLNTKYRVEQQND